jgi:uncharacterized protein (DUF1501 family)
VTRDPAMLLWLNGTSNSKSSPNENYARELMELFTLGAGSGYTQRDVREQARALTGFTNGWSNAGPGSFRFDPSVHHASTSSDFPRRLAGLAAMIAGGLPLRCVTLTSDTQFDTHASQAKGFDSGLSLIADSIAAFQSDLEARGIDDRVLLHVWSEFGRRAQENGSNGTDHGADGVSLLIGTRSTGTMIGEWPGLTNLDANGNLIETVDFRGVYCSLLEQWFNQDAAAVIPGASRFTRYPLIH